LIQLEKWERNIIDTYPHKDIVPETTWQKKNFARNIWMTRLIIKLRAEGRHAEAECRQLGCPHKCDVYWGKKCSRFGGRKIPRNLIENFIKPGKD